MPGEGQRGRGTDQCDDVGIVLEIVAEHGADDLSLVEESGRKERADRPVDKARGQHLFFRRPSFALEEAARDLARGECLFLIVHGQREEIRPGPRLLRGDRGAQHRGLAIGRQHRAIGLPCDPAGLENEAAAAPHQLFSKYLGHDPILFLLSWLSGERHGDAARATKRCGAATAPRKFGVWRRGLSGGAPAARSTACSAVSLCASGSRADCDAGRP